MYLCIVYRLVNLKAGNDLHRSVGLRSDDLSSACEAGWITWIFTMGPILKRRPRGDVERY